MGLAEKLPWNKVKINIDEVAIAQYTHNGEMIFTDTSGEEQRKSITPEHAAEILDQLNEEDRFVEIGGGYMINTDSIVYASRNTGENDLRLRIVGQDNNFIYNMDAKVAKSILKEIRGTEALFKLDKNFLLNLNHVDNPSYDKERGIFKFVIAGTDTPVKIETYDKKAAKIMDTLFNDEYGFKQANDDPIIDLN